jgi:hypothetical protein
MVVERLQGLPLQPFLFYFVAAGELQYIDFSLHYL